MKQFARKDPDSKKLLESRGEELQEYLVQYLAYQLNKGGGNVKSSSTVTHQKVGKKTLKRMNRHTLIKTFGKPSATSWTQSGKLQFRATS